MDASRGRTVSARNRGRRPVPAEPAIDRSVLDELRALGEDGAADLVAELARLFLHDTRLRLEALRASLSRGDAGEIQRIAHALKGSSAIIGARLLAIHCAELEALARSSRAADLGPAVRRVADEIERARRALQAEVGPEGSPPPAAAGGHPGAPR